MQSLPECPVCLVPYNLEQNLPVLLLPCGHGVCQHCVRGLHECPLDRQVVQHSMINFPMRDMIESMRGHPGPHREGPPPTFGMDAPSLCPKHDGQLLEFFCPDELVPCCTRCLVLEHHGHGKPLELNPQAVEQAMSNAQKGAVDQARRRVSAGVEVDTLISRVNTEAELLVKAVRQQQESLLRQLMPPSLADLPPSERQAAMQDIRNRREEIRLALKEVEERFPPKDVASAALFLNAFRTLTERLRNDVTPAPPVDLTRVSYESDQFDKLHQSISRGWGTWRPVRGGGGSGPSTNAKLNGKHHPHQQKADRPAPASASSSANVNAGGVGEHVSPAVHPGAVLHPQPPSPLGLGALPDSLPPPLPVPGSSLLGSLIRPSPPSLPQGTNSQASASPAAVAVTAANGNAGNARAETGPWYRGKVSGLLHPLDGFIAVPLNERDPPLSVYFNLMGGRVTTKNTTAFDPSQLEIGREVWVTLCDNPDQARAREDPCKRFVARAMKLGEPLRKPRLVRGVITVLMHDGKDGFINVTMSDGKTEYKVYYSLSVNSRLQTINLDNTVEPSTLRVGMPMMVELMLNPEVEKRNDPIRKYVARAIRTANK